MNYSQEKIIKAFKEGKIEGEEGIPKHIETVISNVFIFDEFVYKIYKNDNEFFNKNFRDLSTKKGRFDFTKKDFFWNHEINPDIYLELKSCSIDNNKITFLDSKNSEIDELLILMKKVDIERTFSSLMLKKTLSEEKIFNLGKQLSGIFLEIPIINTELDLVKVMKKRSIDNRDWIDLENKNISQKHKEKIYKVLDEKLKFYLNNINNDWLGTCLDIHMENIVVECDEKLLVMDSYAPKEDWLVADYSLNFYRVATDILVLLGEEAFCKFKRGFLLDGQMKINQENEDFYIFYSAIIMWPYMFMLGENDKEKRKIAEIYHKFILENYLK